MFTVQPCLCPACHDAGPGFLQRVKSTNNFSARMDLGPLGSSHPESKKPRLPANRSSPGYEIIKPSALEPWGFPGGTGVKSPPANAKDSRDAGLILRSGRSPGVRNGNSLQYSCYSLWGCKESAKTEQLSPHVRLQQTQCFLGRACLFPTVRVLGCEVADFQAFFPHFLGHLSPWEVAVHVSRYRPLPTSITAVPRRGSQ